MPQGFATAIREFLHLTAPQMIFLVAVSVILGALARIPVGMLTDLHDGQAVFTC
jgi:nitrate/nitrite transporter NarK